MSIPERARRRGAYIVFVDEAGFMLSPLVCRTWAPRGCTPTIKVADQHGRISVIGAISVSPSRRRFNFHYQLLGDNENYCDWSVLKFLNSLVNRLRGPITLLWDQIPIHRSALARSYFNKHRRVVVEPFPAYAPELNPVDYVWSYVKRHRLGNYCPKSLEVLRATLHSEFNRLKKNTPLLRSFFDATGLSGLEPCKVPRQHTSPRPPGSHRQKLRRRFVAFDIEGVECSPASSPTQKIACAATMMPGGTITVWHSGRNPLRPTNCLRKQDAVLLVEYLTQLKTDGYTIVTWNGTTFDFRLLGRVSGMIEQCRAIASDHVDMMFHILCSSGFGVGLNAAARGLGLDGKQMHGSKIPSIWARGDRLKVIDYLKTDVRLTMRIAQDCDNNRKFMWLTQSGKRRTLELPNGWRTVESAARIKKRYNSWNRHDWSREDFVDWLG